MRKHLMSLMTVTALGMALAAPVSAAPAATANPHNNVSDTNQMSGSQTGDDNQMGQTSESQYRNGYQPQSYERGNPGADNAGSNRYHSNVSGTASMPAQRNYPGQPAGMGSASPAANTNNGSSTY